MFPRDRCPKTTFGAAGVILERKPAHEFINAFNYEIMAAFRCNHDIQFLLGGKDAADRIHYCTKYVTKQQKRLDSVVVMALASFRRHQEKERLDALLTNINSSDALATARKRVASIVYTMTNRQEVAGPLAAFYLYRGSCSYESVACSYIPLGDIVRQLCCTEDYSCQMVESETTDVNSPRYLAVSLLDDYIFRHDDLNHINIYEFAMHYFRKKNACAHLAKLSFKASHPQHSTHSLGTRREDVVPVIQGFRLPYVSEHSTTEIRYKHAILSLILFKPFHSLSDLIGATTSSVDQWLDSFTEWEPTRSEFVKMIMSHIDDYYCGIDRARARTDREKQEAPGSANADQFGDSECDSTGESDALFSGGDSDQEDGCSLGTESFVNPWELGETDGDFPDSQTLNPVQCPTSTAPDKRVSRILQSFMSLDLLKRCALSTVGKLTSSCQQEHFPTVQDMRKWVQDDETDNKLVLHPPTEARERNTQVIELLDDAMTKTNMSWWNVPSNLSTPPLKKQNEFASVTAISQQYTLNLRQHHAFKFIGSALLKRWKKAEEMLCPSDDLDGSLHQDQLRLFLGGEGGTRKSRVLDAVQALCESWHRSDCLVKTALTGKAATMISGRTLASFLLQLRMKRKVTSAVYLDILVIDEVSMMRKTQLAQLDSRLRSAKRVPGVPFGGVHVVLVGDFLQLPPVGGDPLYKDPTGTRRQTANELAGFQLWLGFDNVIVLEESVRFRADPEWGRGCQFARKGIWLPEFVDLINSRVTEEANVVEEWDQGNPVPSFITPDNATRLSINNLFVSTVAKCMPAGDYPVRVVADFKGNLKKLGASEVKAIMALPDTKFGRMAPYLDLVVGMPIQITQNIRSAKMAANGTLGTLESIIYAPSTTFCVVYDSVLGTKVKIPSQTPPALIVRISRGSSAFSMKGCIDSDLFPLFSDSRSYNQCQISLAPNGAGMPRQLSVRIEQFPLVCAVSSTVYKVQGETLSNMVVTEWESESRVANKREQSYHE